MQQIYWGFPLEPQTALEARATLARIIEAESRTKKADNEALADLVNQFVHEGLKAYYHEPAHRLKLSPALRATGDKSIRVVAGAMRMVVNGFFGGLKRNDLVAAAEYIDSLIWEPAQRESHYLMFALDRELGEALTQSLNQAMTGEVSHHDVRTLTHQLQQVVDVCMVHYYRHPADRVQLGLITRKTADAGILTVQRAFHTLLSRLLPKLSHEALARLAEHLETLVNREAH